MKFKNKDELNGYFMALNDMKELITRLENEYIINSLRSDEDVWNRSNNKFRKE